MGISLRPAKWNFFALASSNRTSRNAKGQFKELIFSSILICWDIYIAKSLQPKKVIVLDNNDCCKGWTLNGTLQKDFSSAIFAEPKPFCKVPLRVHPLPHSFLSTKRTISLKYKTDTIADSNFTINFVSSIKEKRKGTLAKFWHKNYFLGGIWNWPGMKKEVNLFCSRLGLELQL